MAHMASNFNDELLDKYVEYSIDPNNLLRTLCKSGERYIGEHLNGKPHGRGKQTWPGGYAYVGTFKNGQRHGSGDYIHPSGKKETGFYVRGKLSKRQD